MYKLKLTNLFYYIFCLAVLSIPFLFHLGIVEALLFYVLTLPLLILGVIVDIKLNNEKFEE